MKNNLFFSLVILMMSVSVACAQKSTTIIGKVEGEKAVLTADKALLLKNYNKNLQTLSQIDGNFTDVSIIKAANDYLLVFSGKKYKSVLAIEQKGEMLHAIGKVSCTTSDCPQETTGCIPKFESGSELGTCTPCSNNGKCIKTVASDSLLE
jgi:hypothetical protein